MHPATLSFCPIDAIPSPVSSVADQAPAYKVNNGQWHSYGYYGNPTRCGRSTAHAACAGAGSKTRGPSMRLHSCPSVPARRRLPEVGDAHAIRDFSAVRKAGE